MLSLFTLFYELRATLMALFTMRRHASAMLFTRYNMLIDCLLLFSFSAAVSSPCRWLRYASSSCLIDIFTALLLFRRRVCCAYMPWPAFDDADTR